MYRVLVVDDEKIERELNFCFPGKRENLRFLRLPTGVRHWKSSEMRR